MTVLFKAKVSEWKLIVIAQMSKGKGETRTNILGRRAESVWHMLIVGTGLLITLLASDSIHWPQEALI